MAELENTSARRDIRKGSEEVLPTAEERLADWVDLTARVSDDKMYSWESQAAQYPVTGLPGISYFRGDLGEELFVDCLLYRDEKGELVGILNHYPTEIPPFEREGSQNVWVRPDRRRKGIGTALATEASIRWTAKAPTRDPGEVRLTEAGAKWIKGTEKKIVAVTHVLPVSPDIAYGEWLDPEGMREWIGAFPAVVTRIETDPREGGPYRIDVNDKGLVHSVTGRYLILDPTQGLAFTWRCNTWAPSVPDSWVSVSLESHEEKHTFMTVRHGQLQADLRPGYVTSWGRISVQLEERLARH